MLWENEEACEAEGTKARPLLNFSFKRRVHKTVGQLVKALVGNPDDLSSMSTPHMVEAKNQPLKCPLASSRAPPQHNKKYF